MLSHNNKGAKDYWGSLCSYRVPVVDKKLTISH